MILNFVPGQIIIYVQVNGIRHIGVPSPFDHETLVMLIGILVGWALSAYVSKVGL